VKIFRALARIGAVCAATAVLYPLFIMMRSRRPSIVRRWHAVVARILGIRIVVDGTPPRAPFMLVSNHLSYVDVSVLGGLLETLFVAKADVRDWPALGPLASSTGTLFIDRDSRRDAVRVTTLLRDLVHGGRSVVVFPEGTSTNGKEVLPFNTPLFEAAAHDALPLWYAALRYAQDDVPWFGDATFGSHLWKLLQLPHIDVRVSFGGPLAAADRKSLARAAREAIVSRLSI
jgi:1-acyl-sn-glycerol-3-phosphate acyltransferase